MPNDFPYFLDWLPDADEIVIFNKNEDKAKQLILAADLLVFCDFNTRKRIPEVEKLININKNIKILIDHHPEPEPFVDYIISDTSVSSASELMYEFLVINYGENLNFDSATCLLTGIITDTGLFDHNSETVRTFEIVAKLIKKGVDKKYIIRKIYNENPHRRLQLLGNILYNRMKYLPEYATSYMYLSKEDAEKYNYQDGDTQDFVNIALSLENVNFAVLFTEKEQYIQIFGKNN